MLWRVATVLIIVEYIYFSIQTCSWDVEYKRDVEPHMNFSTDLPSNKVLEIIFTSVHIWGFLVPCQLLVYLSLSRIGNYFWLKASLKHSLLSLNLGLIKKKEQSERTVVCKKTLIVFLVST